MMNNRLIKSLLIVIVLLLFSIDSIAVTTYLSITSTRVGPYIDVSSVTTAGDHVASKTDVTQTLNYRYHDQTLHDYAQINVDLTGTIPSGMRITIQAEGFHMDQYGHSESNTLSTLSNVPGYTSQLLLYNISNKQADYTMTSLLTMVFYVDTYANLHAATTQLTLTYTISIYLI